MELTRREIDGDLLVTVEDERIDACAAVRFRDAMQAACAGTGRRVVVDMTNVTFIDSSGLGAIVGAMKQIGPDRRLELAGLTPVVAKVFRLTRLDEVFRVHADVSAAFGSDAHVG